MNTDGGGASRRIDEQAKHTSAWIVILLPFLLASFVHAQIDEKGQKMPPEALQDTTSWSLFGDVRQDPYAWLNKRDDSRVIAYLEAENAYTEEMTAHTESFREQLYEEMRGRIQEEDTSVPVLHGPWLYYNRKEEGRAYPIYCRKPASGGDEQVILDQNQIAEPHEFHDLGVFEVSPDHNLLAFSEDTTGREIYTLHIKDLAEDRVRHNELRGIYSAVWANDNRTLLYTVLDETLRPYRVYRHTLGQDQAEDELILEESDDRFWVGLQRTRDDRYLLIWAESKLTTEIHLLSADNPHAPLEVFHPRETGLEYQVAHHGDLWYLLTNADGARNFKLMVVPEGRTADRSAWQTVIEESEDRYLVGLDTFRDHLVIRQRADAISDIRIRNLNSGKEHIITWPEEAYSVYVSANPMFDTDTLRLHYSSLITPGSVYAYNMESRERNLLKQDEVGGGYDPDRYVVKRLSAPARDGETVPISLVMRKETPLDGTAPLLLYGYGSYGITISPGFGSTRFSLVDRGVVFAIAHVRGSSAKGRRWYDDGKFLKKKNTFTDFIDCAEYLVKSDYTAPERMTMMGGSAGGLLVGAVLNMRPDLFAGAVAAVPFVDVLTTMLDESIPLTVTEYEEWGNPNEEDFYWYMKSYSPYDNVSHQAYPPILITAGLNDPRVQYWEPAKWTAKLRTHSTSDSPILLKTNMGAGHMGASGRYGRLKETAFEYAFLLDVLGLVR